MHGAGCEDDPAPLSAPPVDAKNRSGESVARSLYEFLRENKILVRYFSDDALTKSFLRISMGTPEQMDRLVEVVDLWQKTA